MPELDPDFFNKMVEELRDDPTGERIASAMVATTIILTAEIKDLKKRVRALERQV